MRYWGMAPPNIRAPHGTALRSIREAGGMSITEVATAAGARRQSLQAAEQRPRLLPRTVRRYVAACVALQEQRAAAFSAALRDLAE